MNADKLMPMPSQGQQALTQLLSGVRETVGQLFDACKHGADGSGLLLQRLLLGLEVLWKLEEQVVAPALQTAAPEWAVELAIGAREVELMRDLALRVERDGPAKSAIALGALEGLARLHWARGDALFVRATATAADWHAMHKDVKELLARWGDEIRARGEIEDEERDPVGLPPR